MKTKVLKLENAIARLQKNGDKKPNLSNLDTNSIAQGQFTERFEDHLLESKLLIDRQQKQIEHFQKRLDYMDWSREVRDLQIQVN